MPDWSSRLPFFYLNHRICNSVVVVVYSFPNVSFFHFLSFSCSRSTKLMYPRWTRGPPLRFLLLSLCLVIMGFAATWLLAWLSLSCWIIALIPSLSLPVFAPSSANSLRPQLTIQEKLLLLSARLCNPDLFLCYIMQYFCCSSNTPNSVVASEAICRDESCEANSPHS